MNRSYMPPVAPTARLVTRQRVSGSFSSFFSRFFCDRLSRCIQNFRISAPSSVRARSKSTISSSCSSNSARLDRRWTRSRSGREYQELRKKPMRPLRRQVAPEAPVVRPLALLVRRLPEGARHDPARIHPLVEQVDALALAGAVDAAEQDDDRRPGAPRAARRCASSSDWRSAGTCGLVLLASESFVPIRRLRTFLSLASPVPWRLATSRASPRPPIRIPVSSPAG